MYSKPILERYGTFRELTQTGFFGPFDGYTICGIGPTSSTGNCREFDNGNSFCRTGS